MSGTAYSIPKTPQAVKVSRQPRFGSGRRLTFTACGVFGMLYALPLTSLLRDPPRTPARLSASATSPLGAMQELFANFSFFLLVLYFTLPAMAGWVVRTGCPPS